MTPTDLLALLDDAQATLRACLTRAHRGEPITSEAVHLARARILDAIDLARALHPDPDAMTDEQRAARAGLSGRVVQP